MKDFVSMADFRKCLRTFAQYGQKDLTTRRIFLAKKGFMYNQDIDVILCSRCGTQVHDLSKESISLHSCTNAEQTQPCSQIMREESEESMEFAQHKTPKINNYVESNGGDSTNTSNYSKMEISDSEISENSSSDISINLSDVINLSDNKKSHMRKPLTVAQAQMDNLENRLESFKNWAKSYPVAPRDLAEAGLYYKGPGDRVKCFECKKMIEKWETGDIPAEEHIKVSPKCYFVSKKSKIIQLICDPNLLSVNEMILFCTYANIKDDDINR